MTAEEQRAIVYAARRVHPDAMVLGATWNLLLEAALALADRDMQAEAALEDMEQKALRMLEMLGALGPRGRA